MGMQQALLIICGILTIAEASTPKLLFANREDIRLVDVGASGKGKVSVVVDTLDDAAAVDFLYDEGYIFWSDVNLEMIKRTVINQTNASTKAVITTGIVSPDGIAVDWIGRKLYWTDAETNRIEVSNLDGSYRKVLYWQKLDQPRAIALDPFHGYMFWTDWGEEPKIERAGMDGTLSTRSIIVDNQIYWPNGLTLDYENSKIYWADAKLSFIHSCDFDGRHRRVVIDNDLPHPFALTLFKNMLYWTDWQTKSIHSCDKDKGDNDKIILSDITSPMDIHVFNAGRQPTGVNPCGDNNGGCSHLCLMSPTKPKFKCACPTGVKLLDDDKTCADGADEMLLLARRTDIRRISLDMPDFTDVVIQQENVIHAIAIDYDPVEGFVYWTDDEIQVLRRARLDGSDEQKLVDTEVHHPDGIAVDWIAGNLYWTDTGTDRIEVARLNGTSRKVLISENLDEPRALCLDPENGYMWWTDWGKVPKIERAYLDGTHREVIITDKLGWPNGIAVDYEENKIYWCDAKADLIEVANMDGTGRRVLVKENLPHLFGFSLLEDYLYWTDWQRRSIERVNKKTGGNRTLIIDHLPDLMGLKAVHVKKVKGTNPCADNNGWCSHLCLYTPKGPQCACPMGLELISKGKQCIVPEAFLLFTRESDIKRMSLSTTHRVVSIPLKGIQKALAIDFDISDNRIYWTDGSKKSISRAFMNGSSLETIVEFGLDSPEGMAVDWVAKNIYWADSGTNRIEVARLDGSSRRVLLWKDLSHPRAIVVDPPNGYLYYTDWSQEPKLVRAHLDGSNREVIIRNIGRVNGLTIDYLDKKLFWADIDKKVIESADLNGENRTRVVTQDVPNVMALTQYEGYLYWTEWERQVIEKANKTSGANRTIIHEMVDQVMDILVFHHSRQSGTNGCVGNNGGCSHLCLALPEKNANNETRICACPTHYTLNPDNRTCTPPNSFLLYSRKDEISRLLVDETDVSGSQEVILPIQGLRNIKALDYDPLQGYAYWISGRIKSIKRSRLDKPEAEMVVNGHSGNIKPFDLAIDPFSHILFWSCSQNNVINFTRIDIKAGGVVVEGNNQKPRYLAVNPRKGHLYWTNNASPATIQRSLLDGTESVTLFTSDLSKPGPIAVDPQADLLFWADLEEKVIECSDLNGGNRRTLLNGKANDQIQTILGIAVFGDYLYWVDKGKKFIARIEKKTGNNLTFVQDRVQSLSDINTVRALDKDVAKKHPCVKDNGNCSHICIAKSRTEFQCSCPGNLVLRDDVKSCAQKTTCKPDEFTCKTANKDCIPNSWLCDGSKDCADNSDEENCPKCDLTEFQCGDGQCIKLSEVCDGISQCKDRDDEDACCENSEQIKCLSGNKCYDKKDKCDGKKDCIDGSDETSCPHSVGETSAQSISALMTVAIVVGVFSIVIVLAIVFACKRKSPDVPFERDLHTMTTLLNQTQDTPSDTLQTGARNKKHDHKSKAVAKTLSSLGSGSGPGYDRENVTGASSSSSAITRYPQTLNPPPSPVTTDRSVYTGDFFGYTTHSPSTVRSKKHRPRNVPPPPTTPCSTDVCEDSEPYYPKKYYNNSVLELNYDSDPYPPPPTPRSQYFSDELMSCPDSPTTERSYFNPYPPPPSPEATSDC